MNLKNNYFFYKFLLLIIFMSSILYADISGTVFRDLPMNGEILGTYGLKDSTEPGIANVEIKGIDQYGIVATATTDNNGYYVLSGLSGKVRVEFAAWSNYLKESPDGKIKNSSIRFSNNGDILNFGLHDPDNFTSTDNPKLISSIFLGGKAAANVGNNASLIKWDYKNYDSEDYDILKHKKDVGSIWGIAYNKNNKSIYAAAVVKRHVGMPDKNGDGKGDAGVIYEEDASGNLSEFYRFTESEVGTIPDDTTRELPNNGNSSTDAHVFDKVGNVGLGGIEFSNKEKKLYVTTLFNQKIYSINIKTKKIEKRIDIPTDECSNPKDARAFTLTYHNGALYVGVTCVALESQKREELKAIIYKYKESTFTKVLAYPLTYKKGEVFDGTDSTTDDIKYFHPWVKTWDELNTFNDDKFVIHPQPLLSDITFVYKNKKEYMVMSILDRTGLQTGAQGNHNTDGDGNYEAMCGGDILIASVNPDGTATLESGGMINGEGGSANDQGPGGGEFFYQDDRANHDEIITGGLTYLFGTNVIYANTYDPVENGDVRTGGIRVFSLENGKSVIGKYLYSQDRTGTMGKATGVGDIEILTNTAPLEIGNRVWEDTDNDGVQDANEIGISGITLELVCGGTIVSTTTTDSNGNYIFSNDANGTDSSSHKYNITALQAEVNNCLVRVPNVTGANKQANLGITILTVANSGEGTNANNNDSDGELNGNNAEVTITPIDIPTDGANNHSYDFGFTAKPQMSIGSLIWEDLNNNGIQDAGESGIANVTITLLNGSGTALADPAPQITVADGLYYFSRLDEGDYSVKVTLPNGLGYIPCSTQTQADNDNSENDSNIKISSVKNYTSGKFTLQSDTEPTEVDGKDGDDADDGDDDNGNMTVDFCFYRPASLGDYVWYDNNKDGIQDTTESGVENVTVKLLNNCDAADVVGTMNTDSNGKYLFSNLDPKDYCVEFSNLPENFMVTEQNKGDGSDDSDSPTTTPYRTTVTTLDPGENDMSWDMGIYKTASIGDTVWYDTDRDGIQDINESKVKDITVTLYQGDCNTTALDNDGNSVATQQTDTNGKYLFKNLSPNEYCMGFDNLPTYYFFSPRDIGNDNNDSDVDEISGKTTVITLSSGEEDTSWDTGIATCNAVLLDDFTVGNENDKETTVNVLGNDNNDAKQNAKIQFISTEEGEILHDEDNGTAVAGSTSSLSDYYYVEGEGNWTVQNGQVLFTADSGFTDIPTPVYYVVKSFCDRLSNVASATITSPCNCNTYVHTTNDSVPISKISMILLALASYLVALLFFREEKINFN